MLQKLPEPGDDKFLSWLALGTAIGVFLLSYWLFLLLVRVYATSR